MITAGPGETAETPQIERSADIGKRDGECRGLPRADCQIRRYDVNHHCGRRDYAGDVRFRLVSDVCDATADGLAVRKLRDGDRWLVQVLAFE